MVHEHTTQPAIEPMWKRRPDWLVAEIDAKFAKIGPTIPINYGRHGENPNYQIATTNFRDLVAHERERAGRLRILEVGCAACYLITQNEWAAGDIVHGLTAHDYRNQERYPHTPPADSNNYFIGNAEHLDQIEQLLPEYDIVLSLYTLQHLIDRAGSLEQIANKVALGGLLCLDRFQPYDKFSPFDSWRRGATHPLPQMGLYAPKMLRILTKSSFRRANLRAVAPQRQVPRHPGEGHVVLRREQVAPVRFGLNYERVEPIENELWVPTWRYTTLLSG